jgi:nicotinamidase/pyrazinamidase
MGDCFCLIVVDMQHDYITGALACPRGGEIIGVINGALALSSSFAGGIFLSMDEKQASDDFGRWPPHCVVGTPGYELAVSPPPSPVPPVLIKKRRSMSAFGSKGESTPLRALLQERGVTHALVCGLALEYCVLETAADCAQMGIRACIVKEGTRPYDAASRRSLDHMPQRLAQLPLVSFAETFAEGLASFAQA